MYYCSPCGKFETDLLEVVGTPLGYERGSAL